MPTPTTTTLPGGEIVVPMSTLLDALAEVLTEQERIKLFGELLKLRPGHVAPGDLIEADLFNRILDDINDLMLRVAMLEAGADTTPVRPRIESITPQIVRSGDRLTVTGSGLGAGNIRLIKFDETLVPASAILPGSTDRTMLIAAPVTPGLPASGRSVVLTVGSSAGTASGSYFQLPEIAQPFQSSVTFQVTGIEPPDAKIAAGKPYTVKIDVAVQVNEDEVFDLAGSVTGTGAKLVSVNPATIAAGPETATDALITSVEVEITTNASGTALVGLSAQGRKHQDAQGSLNPGYTVTVDSAAPVPVTLVTLLPPLASAGSKFETRGGVLTLVAATPTDGSPRIMLVLTATSQKAITFQITELKASATKWNPTLESLATMTLGAGGSDDIMISFDSPPSGADGMLSFNIKSGTDVQAYTLGLSSHA